MSPRPSDPPVTIIASALLPLFLAAQETAMTQAWQAAWSTPRHPGLMAVRRARLIERQVLPEHSPCTPHEWAYAQALHWPAAPGLLPFAAQCAAHRGLSCPSDHGWAFMDAVHWEVNQGQVHLRSAGVVTPEEDQAIWQAIHPYMEEDGIHLHPLGGGRWLAHATHFKQLHTVSLARVLGHDVAYWLDPDSVAAQSRSQRLLRRLQNEMQMLLYTHAINNQRATPINSFWWSGTGDLPVHNKPTQVVLNTDLQAPFAAQDPQAWGAQWLHLADTVIAPALQAGHQLVLCGEDRSICLQAPPHGLWQGLKNLLPRPALKVLLS